MYEKGLLTIGKIGAPYGVLGWLKIYSFTETCKNILDYRPWLVKNGEMVTSLHLECWKLSRKLIVKLKDVNNREMANILKNKEIFIRRAQLPTLQNNEYYWCDLLGCSVSDGNGYFLGVVSEIFETMFYDMLVVQCNFKKKQPRKMIPFIEEKIIKQVDLGQKRIVVDWYQNF